MHFDIYAMVGVVAKVGVSVVGKKVGRTINGRTKDVVPVTLSIQFSCSTFSPIIWGIPPPGRGLNGLFFNNFLYSKNYYFTF